MRFTCSKNPIAKIKKKNYEQKRNKKWDSYYDFHVHKKMLGIEIPPLRLNLKSTEDVKSLLGRYRK